jgi:Immunity protein 72
MPEPKEEVLVRTGEEVPLFGIYEPQVKDGCMNYLLGGVPAPTFIMGSYDDLRAVTWKLIWEDTRYQDGFIPAEENLYFPVEKKSSPVQSSAASDMLSANTAERCPKDGNWVVMDDLQGKLTLKSGDKMPQHKGRDVTWVWVN